MTIKRDDKLKHIPIRFADENAATELTSTRDDDFEDQQGANEIESISVDEPTDELYSLSERLSDLSPERDENVEADSSAWPLIDSLADGEDGDVFDETSHDASPAAASSGPVIAELIATRAELRRVEAEQQKIEAELEKMTASHRDLIGSLARLRADFDNYRKRVERERGVTHSAVVGDVVTKLLPVVDNLHRAISAERSASTDSKDFNHFVQGIRLIEKQLNDILYGYGVELVETVGQRFDPHLHEAIASEENDHFEPETITEEIVRGYRLGERLLRPAMVKVAK